MCVFVRVYVLYIYILFYDHLTNRYFLVCRLVHTNDDMQYKTLSHSITLFYVQ